MPTRRSLLSTAGLALASLAGCLGKGADPTGTEPSEPRTDPDADPSTDTPTVIGGTTTPTPAPETPTPTSERLRFRYRTGGTIQASDPPLLLGDTLYVPSTDFHAISTEGDRRFRLETSGEDTIRPTHVGDRLYLLSGSVGGANTTLYAVSTDGTKRWTHEITENAGQPRVLGATEEGVFVAGFEAPARSPTPTPTPTPSGTPHGGSTGDTYRPMATHVIALDADGSERWRFDVGDVYGEWGGGLRDGRLYVRVPRTTTLFALDAGTGDVQWRFDAARRGPVVTSTGVYVGDTDGRLRAFTLDGRERWRYEPRSGSLGYVAVDGGISYLTDGRGGLESVDATGRRRWRFTSRGERLGRPVPDSGVLHLGSFEGVVYAVDDADGRERWHAGTDGERTTAPVAAGGVVYSHELAHNTLYAFDADTGKGRWRFSPGATPVVGENTVYVGAENGTVYALRA